MGTMIGQILGKTGNSDALNLSRPDVIADIHRQYLAAGADIITTNTFSAQRISQADYHMEEQARQMALEGARIARQCADEFSSPDKPRFVAGSIGPTNKTCSMSPDVSNPALRELDYDMLFDAYYEEADALLEGGVDAVLVETIFNWPGVGQFAYQSVMSADFPAIIGVALLIALNYMVINTVVDILYGVIDPRVRYG